MYTAFKLMAALIIITLLSPLAGYAYGPRGHFRGGVWIGPVWEPWWGPYPYYSAPQVIIERPSPTVEYYMQPAPQQHEEPVYWYYCRKPEGYYPYVKQCPDGWMKVVPTPPSQYKDK
ncbi:MAG: hypothetical protein WCP20_06760 [Desulfuromonadales bacterium]